MPRLEPHTGMKTPWGRADHVRKLLEGIWFVGTPGHGGIKVTTGLNKQIPAVVREDGGWYEEDLAYNWIVAFFPALIETGQVQGTVEEAHATLRNWFPNEYEKVFGVELDPSQSRVRREDLFRHEHKHDWVAIAAWGEWHQRVPTGMVGVCCQPAHLARKPGTASRYFLVPAADYSDVNLKTPIGFICDPPPHPDAPYEEIEKIS